MILRKRSPAAPAHRARARARVPLRTRMRRIEKIEQVTQDLEHNNYSHVQNGLHIVTLAVMAYLTTDVTHPPPELLFQNIDQYLALVEHASGRVLVNFLKYAGAPTVQWQRMARKCEHGSYPKLMAYALHVVSILCLASARARVRSVSR